MWLGNCAENQKLHTFLISKVRNLYGAIDFIMTSKLVQSKSLYHVTIVQFMSKFLTINGNG